MYFFYIDESGTRDPAVEGVRKDGSAFYVWPSGSPLVSFLTRSVAEAKRKQPTLWEWAETRKK